MCVCKRTAQLNLFNNEIKRRFFIFRTTDLKSAKNAPRQAKKVISPSSFGGSTIDDCLASGFTFFSTDDSFFSYLLTGLPVSGTPLHIFFTQSVF